MTGIKKQRSRIVIDLGEVLFGLGIILIVFYTACLVFEVY